MRQKIVETLGMLLSIMVVATPMHAQEKPPAEKPPLGTSAPSASVPGGEQAAPLSTQDRQVISDLQVRAVGYAVAIAALQKELDAVNAEFGRQVQRLAAAAPAGYELKPDLSGYVKKAPPKADPPTK